jgi:hypothetical protein
MDGRQHIDLGKNQRDIAIGQGQLQASKADPEGHLLPVITSLNSAILLGLLQ